ncbi:MAG: SDR family oxidoreductase [Chloroflexi bacterium]|nr:SDR family oxidoreductase [Chloroflexota bacterium]
MHNRVAVVTHGTSELGRGICDALSAAGARVVGAEQAAAPVGHLIQRAVATHGRVDVVVNTYVVTPSAPAEQMSLDTFTQGIAVNLNSIFFGCQFAARQMLTQTPARGTIVNVTSVAGVVALPGHAAFCSALAGVNAITKILAIEWAQQGIRVVGVGAGLSTDLVQGLTVQPLLPDGATIAHRRIPPRTLTDAAEVGRAVAYLASDDAEHIAGTTLFVDGGWLADGYWE